MIITPAPIIETITFSDSLLSGGDQRLSVSDHIFVTESSDASPDTYVINKSDFLDLSDSFVQGFGLINSTFDDTIAISESISAGLSTWHLSLTDTIPIVSAFARNIVLSKTDTLSLTESYYRGFEFDLDDLLGLTESETDERSKYVHDLLNFAEDICHSTLYVRSLSDTIPIVEEIYSIPQAPTVNGLAWDTLTEADWVVLTEAQWNDTVEVGSPNTGHIIFKAIRTIRVRERILFSENFSQIGGLADCDRGPVRIAPGEMLHLAETIGIVVE